MKRGSLADWKKIGLTALAAAAFMWVLLYAPTPFVVLEPGIAVPVKPMIKAEAGDQEGEGDFLLTAVRMIEPNLWGVITAAASRDREVYSKRAFLGGYSEKEYVNRLSIVMEGSQNNAVEAAYRYLGLPYSSTTTAIRVSDAKSGDGMGVLKAGDRLLGINGSLPFESVADLVEQLQKLSSSQIIKLDIERDGVNKTIDVYLEMQREQLTAQNLPAALGIEGLTELRRLDPADIADRLQVTAGSIGGPSAGLVFALQAINLLTEGDLTGGERVAVTGTIAPDGKIGPIGGIRQKVVKASEEGATYFLVPAGNYDEAALKAKAIGTRMIIIKAATLEEAMKHMHSLGGVSLMR